MNSEYKKLAIGQIDKKLSLFKPLAKVNVPNKGWVNTIRTILGMSLRQLGERLEITPQSVKEIEEREVSGSITLKSLRETARALDMQVVYSLVPIDENLESIIEKRAHEIATSIVMRTSQSMSLEGQENSSQRLKKAIAEKTEEIKRTMPKYLWD